MTCFERRRLGNLCSSLLIIGTLLGLAADLKAQQLEPPLATNDRIQLRSSALASKWRTGKVESLAADSLVFRDEKGGATTTIPFTDLQELRVSRGSRFSGTRVATMSGAGLGLGLVGSLLFWSAAKEGDASLWRDYQESHLIAAGIGAAVGGLLGVFKPGESWVNVRIQPHRTASFDSRVEFRFSWPQRRDPQ